MSESTRVSLRLRRERRPRSTARIDWAMPGDCCAMPAITLLRSAVWELSILRSPATGDGGQANAADPGRTNRIRASWRSKNKMVARRTLGRPDTAIESGVTVDHTVMAHAMAVQTTEPVLWATTGILQPIDSFSTVCRQRVLAVSQQSVQRATRQGDRIRQPSVFVVNEFFFFLTFFVAAMHELKKSRCIDGGRLPIFDWRI